MTHAIFINFKIVILLLLNLEAMATIKSVFFCSGLWCDLNLAFDNNFVAKLDHFDLPWPAPHGLIRVYPDVGLGMHKKLLGHNCWQFCFQ
jgi:hypothetical protein